MTSRNGSNTSSGHSTKVENEIYPERVEVDGEAYFKISNSNRLRPFFMSIVSDSDHWLFIGSNGGLTAGRRNASYSLFPYYTDDKIIESVEHTGSKTVIRIQKDDKLQVWEPFSFRSLGYKTTTNLYKSELGNKVRFEQVNHDLNIIFYYEYSFSDTYGIVRTSHLQNQGSSPCQLDILDGWQNILPAEVPTDLQNNSSNLVDAYKRTELEQNTGLGIYALSAVIVDRAEPSEALYANTVWSAGLDQPTYLLSSRQIDAFRAGATVKTETDVKAERGAYLLVKTLRLDAGASHKWHMVAGVHQNHSEVAGMIHTLQADKDLLSKLHQDVDTGSKHLQHLVASADGLQCTSDKYRDARHYSNVLFNIMRGGIFDDGYTLPKADLTAYLRQASKAVYQRHATALEAMDSDLSYYDIVAWAATIEDHDLRRLVVEYLPLKFSRRHGDPSRPWNRFSINIKDPITGGKMLDYEGNWRDIFQNWEALLPAYPKYVEGMISRFVNASTFDGYNPYRITKGGFDWEISEPDDPWSYIGYWGDHQVIYLLKFLEFSQAHFPQQLPANLDKEQFVYAHVPYRIKPYDEILRNPKDTIEFDVEADKTLRAKRTEAGADGTLRTNQKNDIHRVNLLEKLLATILAKVSNYIPEGGVWMNTQRPEWNDANNALVGNGVSMVTLYYLRRFTAHLQEVLSVTSMEQAPISSELAQHFEEISDILSTYQPEHSTTISDADRKQIVDLLGQSASQYRETVYDKGFSGDRKAVSTEDVQQFLQSLLAHLDHSIVTNRRSDKMYHAYNLITLLPDGYAISHLDPMLEGQVAVLSSGYLSSAEALEVLDGLKASPLFRHDQYSYILYPAKELKGFLQRNEIPTQAVESSAVLQELANQRDTSIIERDVDGTWHFHSDFRNAEHLSDALDALENMIISPREHQAILDIYESVFNHKSFTGRSGTFYGYEGLGSIYWHMVSKLLLATQEVAAAAIKEGAESTVIGQTLEHFYEVYEGLGVHKSVTLYGAFPTDPYSHTPAHKGAQQPGMTGQVKEDILARYGELGVTVSGGGITFRPNLLRKSEFLEAAQTFHYVDLQGKRRSIEIGKGQLAFTYCQVPIIYTIADQMHIKIQHRDGSTTVIKGPSLDAAMSDVLFERTGSIEQLIVSVDKHIIK